MNTASHTLILNIQKDIWYSVTNGVMKPIKRQQALVLIADTAAMIVSGNLARFVVLGQVQ